ncbi:hypothetical protein Tco_0126778 [Tanacetum coccineum]
MTTQSAGRPAATSRGGGIGGRAGKGGGRTIGGQGREVNDGVDGVPDFSTIKLLSLLISILESQVAAASQTAFDAQP